MENKKIIIGADPSGFELKEAVKKHLAERGFEVTDVGTLSENEQVLYYEVGARLGKAISDGEFERGILFCGSGMGVNLMANRYPRVLCGCCESVYSVNRARAINNINVLAMGGFFQGAALGCAMADAFLDTPWLEGLGEEDCRVVKEGYKQTIAASEGNLK